MSKAIREAEKRARAREETRRRYYEPLPSPPPRHSSPSGNPEEKWLGWYPFKHQAERAKESHEKAGIKCRVEPAPSPLDGTPGYSLIEILKESSGNPDRKKVLELLSKLMADEIEAESKYRDAALVAHTAGFPALMRSLNMIANEEAIHRRKIGDLISQLEVY